MDVLAHCVLVLDADGQPTEVVRSREAQDALDYNGVKMAEYVPADQLRGAVEAIREAYTALCADDLGPNVTVEAVEEARRVLAVVIAQPRGGQ